MPSVSRVQHGDYRWWDRFERGVLAPCAERWPVAMPIDDIYDEWWVAPDRRVAQTCDEWVVIETGLTDDEPRHICQQYLVGLHLEVVLTVSYPEFELAELAWRGGPPMPYSPFRLRSTAVPFSYGGGLLRSLDLEDLAEAVTLEVRRLSTRRRKRYRRCEFCHEMVPPEERFSPSICLGCASQYLGIVF